VAVGRRKERERKRKKKEGTARASQGKGGREAGLIILIQYQLLLYRRIGREGEKGQNRELPRTAERGKRGKREGELRSLRFAALTDT